MEAKDLRIGNIIYDELMNPVIVSSIASFPEFEIYDAGGNFVNDPGPIQLTEEWLLKFGFEKVECCNIKREIVDWNYILDNEYYQKDRFYFLESSDKSEGDIYIRFHGFNIKECKYVHQLQNLFYALCGEELVINDAIVTK